MIGRATGLALAALVAVGGLALAINALAIAGQFTGPVWVAATIWAVSGLAGLAIGTTGAMMMFKWVETARTRKAHDDAR